MLASVEVHGAEIGVSLVFGVLCALIASGRGRSGIGWFFVGFFLSCIGLVLVLVLPNLKEEHEGHQNHQLEARRLREQLAKERQIADQRHSQIDRRLGAHDQALGLRTDEAPELAGYAAPPELPDRDLWFYARGKERLGPVSADTLRHLLQAKAIDRGTLLWCEGMPDWVPLAKVEQFGGDLA